MAEFNVNQYINPGKKFDPFGDAVRGYALGQEIKQQRISKKNQETLGGLRRKIVGLDNATSKEQEEAAQQYIAMDPEAASQLFDTYAKMDTSSKRKVRISNERTARAGAFLQSVPDELLLQATQSEVKRATDNGNLELAEQMQQLIPMIQNDIGEARRYIDGGIAQSRDLENIIASNEKLRKENAESKILNSDSLFAKTDKLGARVEVAATTFKERREAMNGLKVNGQTALAGNTASQVAVIFNFMKILDPRSVVRESEVDLARAQENIPGWVMAAWRKAEKGDVISDKIIQRMLQTSDGAFGQHQKQYMEDMKKYKLRADKWGIDWKMIANDETGTVSLPPKPTPTAVQALRQNDNASNRTKFKAQFGYLPDDLY